MILGRNFDDLDVARDRPLILAHRGHHADVQENSLASILRAQPAGADGVEVDLRLSADGVIVLSHDQDFAGIDIVSTEFYGAESRLRRSAIATLADLVQSGPDQLYNLELKSDPLRRTDSFLQSLCSILGDRVDDPRYLISSFDRSLLVSLKKRVPKARIALLVEFGAGVADSAEFARDLSLYGLNIHRRRATKANIDLCRRGGQRVSIWTVDSPREAEKLSYYPVTALITNKIAEVRQAIELSPSR